MSTQENDKNLVDVVSIPVSDILDLVNCAETYGHSNQIILEAFASWLDYSVSDEDIQAYSRQYLTEECRKQGYGEEDCEDAIQTLTEWRDRYCTPEKAAEVAARQIHQSPQEPA